MQEKTKLIGIGKDPVPLIKFGDVKSIMMNALVPLCVAAKVIIFGQRDAEEMRKNILVIAAQAE
ncbi:MAG: hypothetical protein AAGB28_18915, partial [Pseudomonadota bacterium]